MSPLLTPKQVASALNVKIRQVYILIRRNRIASLKIGRQIRISQEALAEFLKAQGSK